MKIGFDIDGVLADFNKSYAPLVTARTGVALPEVNDSYPDTWNYAKAAGIDDSKVWEEAGNDPQFWLGLPPTRYCAASLDRLQDLRADGNEIYFITSRPGVWAGEVAVAWLAISGFINAEVHVATNAEHKAYLAKNLGLDFFIDDKPENCEAVSHVVPDTYLLDQPWNRYWDNDYEAILRVSHPVEAIDHFIRGGELRGLDGER